MRCLTIFLFSAVLIGCSHADNSKQQNRENEISNNLTSRTMAISDDIAQSRRLYISAYQNINSKSDMNNELYIYTIRKIDSLIGNYEVDQDNFENDIKNNKKISVEAVDGLCIMNKFVEKYSTFINMNNVPESLQQSMKEALKYQPIYIKRLSTDKDYLGQLECLNLK